MCFDNKYVNNKIAIPQPIRLISDRPLHLNPKHLIPIIIFYIQEFVFEDLIVNSMASKKNGEIKNIEIVQKCLL